MEKRYGQEVQKLCRILGFGLIRNSQPEEIDHEPLGVIVVDAEKTAPLLISLVQSVGPTSRTGITFHLISMKLLAILVILC